MAYRFPGSDHFSPPQYQYRRTIPSNLQETRAVLFPTERPYRTHEVAYAGARRDGYAAFQEGSYPARETVYHPTPPARQYPTFLESPYEAVRERSFLPEGPYQSLMEGTYQDVPAEPHQSLYEQVPYQQEELSRPSPHLFGHCSTRPPLAQHQAQRVSDSSNQTLTDLLRSDNSATAFTDGAGPSGVNMLASPHLGGPSRPSPHPVVYRSIQPPPTPQLQAQGLPDSSDLDKLLQIDDSFDSFVDGAFDSADEAIADAKIQRPETDFEELDLGLPSSTGGPVEDQVDNSALTLREIPPNPVHRQWGEYGDLKVFLEELTKTTNRKLDIMGKAWANFADDVTMRGQADDEWKDTIEQRLEDHTNQQLTDMEMRMTEQMAKMERSHQQRQQKMQEQIDLFLERGDMDEESDY